MGRQIYAITLTFAWFGLLTLRPHGGVTAGMLIPAMLILGAWLAAAGVRIGYVVFCVTSIVLTFLLGFMSMASLPVACLYFMGGQVQEVIATLGIGVALLFTAVLQFIGLGVLKPSPALIRSFGDA